MQHNKDVSNVKPDKGVKPLLGYAIKNRIGVQIITNRPCIPGGLFSTKDYEETKSTILSQMENVGNLSDVQIAVMPIKK